MDEPESTINMYDELPDWSNKENIEKHQRILKKSSDLQVIKNDCNELKERVGILSDHLKNVQQEVNTTQQLLSAKHTQVDEETHIKQLFQRERGKIKADLSKLESLTTDIQAKWSEVQAKIFKSQQRVEAFKEEAKMNQQELDQWVVIARQKEEDFLVLQRYKREDEGKIRSMLLELEKGTSICDSKRNELNNEITATRALQIELDMIAEHFRKMHDERSQLLEQWENTMKQMQSLNSSIEKSTTQFDSRKVEVERLNTLVNEEKKNLESSITDNQNIERQLTIGDHKVSQLHKQFEKDESDLLEFNETVETQRHQLEKLESEEKALSEEISHLKSQTKDELFKREELLKRLEETEKALGAQKGTTSSLDEQTSIMNDFLKKEETQLKSLETSIATGKQSIFKLSQEVSEVKKKEADLHAEMQGSQTRAKNLQMKIQDFDRETQKQMELLYNSNFQIQQMERKIARIEGERTEEEKLELQTQIDKFSKVLDSKLNDEKNQHLQLHRLELDIRQTKRKKETIKTAQQDLEVKLNEIRLDQDSLDKSTIKSRSQKETVLVQLNMLRLQVEKLSDNVNMKSDELISLENRRHQLQLSMEERVHEIDSHLAALRTQLKTEEEARHVSSIELMERHKRADTLEAKYKVMMGKYQVDGEEVSQSYHVIKFAQEREEVTRRGDMLENEVKKAIQELRALEKAMERLNGQNASFRSIFTSVSENDNDMERKKVLDEQVRVAQQRMNARRAEARSVSEERQAMENTYHQQEQKIQSLLMEISKLKPQQERLTTENSDLREKITRATHMLTKAKEKHRKDTNVPLDLKYPSTLLEMDIELRMEKSNVEAAVAELIRIAENNREIEPKLRLALTQMGMPIKQFAAPPTIMPKGPVIMSPHNSANGSGRTSQKSTGRSSITSYRSNGSAGSTASRSSQKSIGAVRQINLSMN